MFSAATTFVIGAGASTEYGLIDRTTPAFPVGSQLRELIRRGAKFQGRLDFGSIDEGDRVVWNWLWQRYRHSNADVVARVAAAHKIAKGLNAYPSIDAFIEQHDGDPHVAEIGKVMIARYIAEAERNCTMRAKQDGLGRISIDDLEGTWIERFVRILMDGRRDPRDIGREVTVICFNYDRCIEYYLINAIIEKYDVTYAESHSIVAAMNIIHPYGVLGALPPHPTHADNATILFGPDLETLDPWSMIGTLKTYTERVEEEVTVSRIRIAVAESENLVFLGFGFTSENMKLLDTTTQSDRPRVKQHIVTTGIGLHKQAEAALRTKVSQLFSAKHTLGMSWPSSMLIEYDSGCSQLLEYHWHNLIK